MEGSRYRDFDNTPIIECSVGLPPVRLQVHEYLICHYSKYFSDLCRERRHEAQEYQVRHYIADVRRHDIITLTIRDIEPKVFEIVLHCLYNDGLVLNDGNIEGYDRARVFILVWLALDKLDIDEYKAQVLELLKMAHVNPAAIKPSSKNLDFVFDETFVEVHPLRAVMAHVAASWCLKSGRVPTSYVRLCRDTPDFGADMARVLVKAMATYHDPIAWPISDVEEFSADTANESI